MLLDLSEAGTPDVTYQLYVNPADPIIAAAKTAEGDTIFLIGNKTSDGLPTSADEFHIINEEGTTYVSLGDDGTIQSAVNSDGLQMDLIWGENYTHVHVSLVLNNGSDQQQILINVNLTEPINNTSFNLTDQSINKRDLGSISHVYEGPDREQITRRGIKRQTRPVNSAKVNVFVQTCQEPEPNARVFANVLVNYDEETGGFDSETRLMGRKSDKPGEYKVYIPTSAASEIGERTSEICDGIEMVLRKACGGYSKINKIAKFFTGYEAKSLVCFAVGKGLPIVFPQLRLLPIYRFCRTAFKGVDWYCSNVNKKLKVIKKTPAQLICDAINNTIDRTIDYFNIEKLHFTPTAVFPTGNSVTGEGQVITVSTGSSEIATRFTIHNDQLNEVKIKHFAVVPVDPSPGESYVVQVSYECYSSRIRVTMSIIGTDNYRNSITCLSGPSCTLRVPGAAALVMDTVTVMISDEATSTLVTRTVSIIF